MKKQEIIYELESIDSSLKAITIRKEELENRLKELENKPDPRIGKWGWFKVDDDNNRIFDKLTEISKKRGLFFAENLYCWRNSFEPLNGFVGQMDSLPEPGQEPLESGDLCMIKGSSNGFYFAFRVEPKNRFPGFCWSLEGFLKGLVEICPETWIKIPGVNFASLLEGK